MEYPCWANRLCRGSLVAATLALFAAGPSALAETSSWEPGMSITTKRAMRILAVRSAAQCREACLANGRCAGWNFEPSSRPHRRARHRCELFARVEGKRPARGRAAASSVAGVKRATPDRPTADAPDPAKNALFSPATIAAAGVAKAAGALPSARELARRRKREAALRAATVENGVRRAASAIAAAATAARTRAEWRDRATLAAVKAGASALPSERTLARLRREAARQRTAWIADAIEKGASALPSPESLARARQEEAARRDAIVAGAVHDGAAALPSRASLARMRRETSALIASIELAVVEQSASLLSAAAARVQVQREISSAAISGAVGDGAAALHAAAARQQERAATMAAGVSEGASWLAAEVARAQKDALALRAGAELGGVRQGASMLRAASPAARPSAKAPVSSDRPARAPEPPPPTSARRSTWEPGSSLAGFGFAFDEAGAGAGYRTPDAEACRDLCLRHAPCGGWKFTGQQYPHPDLRSLCFLYSKTPSRHPSAIAGVISGVIHEAR
jgi:hypothetical protein